MNNISQAISSKQISKNIDDYQSMARALRILCIDAIEQANSGHPGMALGMADVITVLFKDFLKFNPYDANWTDRDRFILSAGHGSILLYSVLHLVGYPDVTIDELKNFRKFNSKAAGHPEYGHFAGIEATTGPLGQGVANAVGMAIAEKLMNNRFGSIVDHYTYVVAGDGCLMEGISQESISLAAHLRLNKLIILFDDNKITIDGPINLTSSENQVDRFTAANWFVQQVDGHNYQEIHQAILNAKNSDKPSMIATKTIIGYGAPNLAGSNLIHGSPLGKVEAALTKNSWQWLHEEFSIPAEINLLWQDISKRTKTIYDNWQQQFLAIDDNLKSEFNRTIKQILPSGWQQPLNLLKKEFINSNKSEATRRSSGRVIAALADKFNELIGGSADLTTSNETKTSSLKAINSDDFSGSYIHYGIREHAMAGIMNGIALHKGLIPYGGTFLAFSDYMRPSIRLAAMMRQRIIYIMSHDSIGLGEDGPTHQPIEHLASLRAIPNLYLYRPADGIETIEAWQLALTNLKAPSIISLSRQALPMIRNNNINDNLSAKGAYLLLTHQHELQVTIIATGSEVHLALKVGEQLEKLKIGTNIISMPCSRLFDEQSSDYRAKLLTNNSLKVAIEAATSMGWAKYIDQQGLFFGIEEFGISGSALELYKHFGLTHENIVNKITEQLAKNKL